MQKLKTLALASLIFGATVSTVLGQQAAKNTFVNKDNVALGGYDVVAYFTQNEAVRGNKKFAINHGGATYWFTDLENKTKFESNPEQFLPQFGGYCAFAVAMKGAKVPSDPRTFKLHDGKLYLFFNDYYEGAPFNTIIPWNADEVAMLKKAKNNWKKM